MPQQSTPQESAIASLYIQAVRQGQSLWFQVASNSMTPMFRVGDEVHIEPARANEIRPGEIAAFETANGLMIHRIICCQETGETVRLLQMADIELHASWVEEQAVVGRVITIRRQARQTDLRHPIVQWCGKVTAQLRYQSYIWKKYRLLKIVLRRCSRLVIHISYWCIRRCCSSSETPDDPSM